MITLTRSTARKAAAAGLAAAALSGGAVAYALGSSAPSASGAGTSASLAGTPLNGIETAARTRAGLGAAAGGAANLGGNGANAGARRAARGRLLKGLVFGKVTTITSGDGALGAGTISVLPPDGTPVTASLARRTRVLAYHGPGQRPTAEQVSDIQPGEMVAVRVLRRTPGAASNAGGNGSSGNASVSGSLGGGAATLTAVSFADSAPTGATPTAAATPSGTVTVAAVIVDLGYTAAG